MKNFTQTSRSPDRNYITGSPEQVAEVASKGL